MTFKNRKFPAKLFTLSLVITLLYCPQPAFAQEPGRIENAEALAPFVRSLIEMKAGSRNRRSLIVQYGDSHTAADYTTAVVRRRFQSDFGMSRGGDTGVDFHILGINGMRASKLLQWSDSQYAENVTAHNPDLIILAYGTNEVTDRNWTRESYKRMFAAIIRRFRSASPGSSILVIGPPDRLVQEDGRWTPARKMPALLEAQRQAAFEEGAAFWSACAAMGGPGAIGEWYSRGLAQKDMVHLTRPGYALLGNLFYDDFARAFNLLAANYQSPKQPEQTKEPPSRTVGRSIRFRKSEPDTNRTPQ